MGRRTDIPHGGRDGRRQLDSSRSLQRWTVTELERQGRRVLGGNGATTRAAARLAAEGFVLGVALSERMIGVAHAMAGAENVRSVAFEQADAKIYTFAAQSLDIAISRAGTMFLGDPVAAFSNIARALRPQGRIALLVWQSLPSNEWMASIRGALAAGRDLPLPPPDAPTAFSMADPDRNAPSWSPPASRTCDSKR